MVNQSLKRLLNNIDINIKVLMRHETYQGFWYNVLSRHQSQWSKSENMATDSPKEPKDLSQPLVRPSVERSADHDSLSKQRSDEIDFSSNRIRLDVAWLTKALEPALQLCRWALPTGNGIGNKLPPINRSLTEIIASIQRSKLGLQDWSLSDFTIGLYLIYLQQASTNPFEDVKGVQITSESVVQDLIYHTELAKGAYKESAASLARYSMLRESNIVKFVKDASVLRPAYYIGIDNRRKLVVLGIRGTHTVYDLITDIVSSSNEEVTFEGHFGTAEAARWLLTHEMGTIRMCLEKHKGFRLRLVGHSLGGAAASLLAMMLHKKSLEELGFSPDIVSAVGYGTPPCVSRELAESCSDYVTTVVMQDDIIPRLSVASLTRLRNEILQTDWMSVLQKEDWKGVIELLSNAKQVVSSVQDVARRLADYANFRNQTELSGTPSASPGYLDASLRKESPTVSSVLPPSRPPEASRAVIQKDEGACKMPEELFVPGTLYYLKRNVDSQTDSSNGKAIEFFTLWKRDPGEHFRRILLSSNLISDHKCDSHYYALRDVLKGLPGSSSEDIF